MREAVSPQARPVRLLQLVPDPLPAFRADVAVLFGKYLPRHGVRCDVVGKGSTAALQEQGFASVRRAAVGARWKSELSFAWLCLRTLLSTRRADCDVVQVRDMVSIGALGLLVARLKGIRFTYWMSFLMCEARIERARARLRAGGGLRDRLVLLKGLAEYALLQKVVLRFADHVFVQSDAMADLLAGQGIPRAKMTPVPMGVDMEALSRRPEPRRLPGWEGVPVLAYLGTLDPMRDIDMVIDALVLIRREYPDARLLLIGEAPHKADTQRLRDYAASLGLGEAVHITGWLPAQEAWQLLAGADAAVSYFPRGPILDTNSPTKVLEYLAMGIPSLGNDNPDQRLVMLESGAGWLTESSPAALAAASCRIFADPAAAIRQAAAGPAYIEAKRSYRVLSAAVAQRYQSLLAKN